MDLNSYRSQFDIAILGPEVDEILLAQDAMAQEGHTVWRVPNESAFVEHFKEHPAQLVIIHLLSLERSLEDLLVDLQEIAPSAFFIAVGLPTQSPDVHAYFPYGVVGFAELGNGLAQRLRWLVDLIMERVVAASQVKVLQRELEEERIRATEQQILAQLQNQQLGLQKTNEEKTEDWSNLLTAYEGCKSKDEMLTLYAKSLEGFLEKGIKVLYFKFLAPVASLTVTHSMGIDPGLFKDLGVVLNVEEQKKPKNHLSNPSGFSSLNQILNQNFPGAQFRTKPLLAREEVEGVFVFLSNDISVLNNIDFNNRFYLFKTAYERFVYLRRVVELEINDAVTQLLTVDQFNDKLEEEIARARRLLQPVSIVKITIDQLQKIEEEYGDVFRDNVIKQIAGLLKKTSRVNDILSRTALNEFTLILPHSPQQGAMIKAERLRRIVESTNFPNVPFKLTFSLGVNEFPTYAGNASTLVKGSLMALTTVIQRGGNKIGTAKAPTGYQPEYQYVLPETPREFKT